ncbi:universal stress protein [Polaromonas eurypsychrophila]|uniref:Universal stress protein UspA n=1 Tax=Polaromonas eurypsychrophila TaxID=1614635 RepID=A0A916SNM4_9BURK|nr:universal stress protein [Polaromonas eurypsychrophila]GGB09169.1 universal stress protein UspA [Polaromonas eurypsychrophila]
MKILFAADGSQYTKKALAFLVTHESLAGPDGEVVVLNVQTPVPGRVKSMLGSAEVAAYHAEESQKVLAAIERFLKRHKMAFKTLAVVGAPTAEILRAAKREKVHLIVMGTHGHGLLGRAVMGSVAQRVVTDADIPVLLVK